jgi:hypothetical protein
MRHAKGAVARQNRFAIVLILRILFSSLLVLGTQRRAPNSCGWPRKSGAPGFAGMPAAGDVAPARGQMPGAGVRPMRV